MIEWVAAAAAVVSAGAGTVTAGIFHPRFPLFGPVTWHGPRSRKAIALSFDDGPHPDFTPRVVDALEAAGAKATFFCVGKHVAQHPQLARELVAKGHEVANHTFEHNTAAHLFVDGKLRDDLARAQQAYADAGLPKSSLYRPAVGIRNPVVHQAAKAHGFTVVTWADSARDGRIALTDARARAMATRATAGDILCLHDGVLSTPRAVREETVRHLPALLQSLRARGFELVTVSQLLG